MGRDETQTTTFSCKEETVEWLREAYPDALGLNEQIRNAIADARKVRDADWSVDVHMSDD